MRDDAHGAEATAAEIMKGTGEIVLDIALPPAGTLLRRFIEIAEKRRSAIWSAEVERRLTDLQAQLERQGLTLDVHEDKLADAYVMAMQAVLTTSDTWKLHALQNAVLNTALDPPEDEEGAIALTFIARLSPTHLRVLRFLAAPKREIEALRPNYRLPEFGGNVRFVWRDVWPDYAKREETLRLVVRDLHGMGLLQGDDPLRFSIYAVGRDRINIEPSLPPMAETIARLTDEPVPGFRSSRPKP